MHVVSYVLYPVPWVLCSVDFMCLCSPSILNYCRGTPRICARHMISTITISHIYCACIVWQYERTIHIVQVECVRATNVVLLLLRIN